MIRSSTPHGQAMRRGADRSAKMSAVAQHTIDPDNLPYAPERLDRKADVGAEGLLALELPHDVRPGSVVA